MKVKSLMLVQNSLQILILERKRPFEARLYKTDDLAKKLNLNLSA